MSTVRSASTPCSKGAPDVLRRRDSIFFVCAFLSALLIFLPMRIIVGVTAPGGDRLAAREVTGTLWSGTFRDAQLGPVRFGVLDARFRFGPLLLGRAAISLSEAGGQSAASLFASPGGFGFSDVDSRFTTAGLLAPLPLAAFELERVSAMFAGGRCIEAGGFVRAYSSPAAAGIGLPQSFSGTPRCDGPLILLPLMSDSGMEAIDLRLDSAGRYEANVRLRSTDAATVARLSAAGFRRTSRGYAARMRGTF